MKTLKVSRKDLIETIAAMTDDFGNDFIKIFVSEDNGVDFGENVSEGEHVILTMAGLGCFNDDSDVEPGSDGYDSMGAAEYIVDNGILETSAEYDDDSESVEFEIV